VADGKEGRRVDHSSSCQIEWQAAMRERVYPSSAEVEEGQPLLIVWELSGKKETRRAKSPSRRMELSGRR